MTEREWLLQLYEDVRAYFRYEAKPVKQAVKEQVIRKTMLGYQSALQEDDFDEESYGVDHNA